jgi:hypothetical protein
MSRKIIHAAEMSEKSTTDRLDECEKFQESQQTELQKHSERLRDLESLDLKRRVAELEDDLRFAIKNSFTVQRDFFTILGSRNVHHEGAVSEVRQFIEKYQIMNR